MTRKQPYTFLIDAASDRRLTELSERHRVSRSLIVRETLAACLSRWEHERLSGVPMDCQGDAWLGPDEPTGDDR